MKLYVCYDNIKKTFEGDNVFELFDRARADELYDKHNRITFELEEVDDGNISS